MTCSGLRAPQVNWFTRVRDAEPRHAPGLAGGAGGRPQGWLAGAGGHERGQGEGDLLEQPIPFVKRSATPPGPHLRFPDRQTRAAHVSGADYLVGTWGT